jgi:hypothetical protein
MEAAAEVSDCDLIVILADDAGDWKSARRAKAYAAVWAALDDLGLGRPKPGGVFAEPTWLGHLTDRVAIYAANNDPNIFRLLGFYNTYLSVFSKKAIRDQFAHADTKEYQNRYKLDAYATLKSNSDGLVAELLRFALDRRGKWSERFFEYLIF